MTKPFLLAQLSDPHIGATWTQSDPAAKWREAIACLGRLPDPADAILVSGDLVDHAGDAEYAVVKSALDTLDVPTYVLPGNHDDRALLRKHFGLPGEGDERVHYAVDLGPVRLVVLDTVRAGHDSGELAGGQLEWLEAELSAAPHQVTLIALHHPPFLTGMRAWDAIGLPASDRAALRDLVRRHPQVLRILSGHVHCPITGQLDGCIAVTAPSTYIQARPRFESNELELSYDAPAFAVHAVAGTDVVSYVEPVTGFA